MQTGYIYDAVLLLSSSRLTNLRDLLQEDNFNNTFLIIKVIPTTTIVWNHCKCNEKNVNIRNQYECFYSNNKCL